MLSLTKQERLALIVVCFVLLIGSSLHWAYQQFPFLARITQLADNEIFFKVDINKANHQELQKIPTIGPVMAERIVARRNRLGKFKKMEDLKSVKGIGESKYRRIKKFIKI